MYLYVYTCIYLYVCTARVSSRLSASLGESALSLAVYPAMCLGVSFLSCGSPMYFLSPAFRVPPHPLPLAPIHASPPWPSPPLTALNSRPRCRSLPSPPLLALAWSPTHGPTPLVVLFQMSSPPRTPRTPRASSAQPLPRIRGWRRQLLHVPSLHQPVLSGSQRRWQAPPRGEFSFAASSLPDLTASATQAAPVSDPSPSVQATRRPAAAPLRQPRGWRSSPCYPSRRSSVRRPAPPLPD